MKRNIFLGHLMASVVAMLNVGAAPSLSARVAPPQTFAPKRGRGKYRAQPYAGKCRVTIWSGIKKRMRAARRGIPLTY